jgi:4-hydroxy-2-oxoheptanedioate aldolase
MLQAISTTDTVPIVRVPWNEPGIIMKMLDAGAYGVIIPMVNSRSEAEAAAAACRYAPAGIRSYGPARAVLYAGPDYVSRANDTVLCIPMIETREAVANVDEIVGTPGVDVAFIGPSDLSVSLGLPPSTDQDAAEFVEAVAGVEAACRRHGVVPGVFCGNATVAAKRIEQGFRLLQVADDGRTMVAAAASALAQLRQP